MANDGTMNAMPCDNVSASASKCDVISGFFANARQSSDMHEQVAQVTQVARVAQAALQAVVVEVVAEVEVEVVVVA